MLLYWGWYWRRSTTRPLIAAQLVFAYAFDMLLLLVAARDLHARLRPVPGHLQHQPVPLVQARLVLSAVLMVALGFAGQGADALDRDGGRVHIFNPSSFPLAVRLGCSC